MSAFDLKNYVLEKLKFYTLQLPNDIYVLHFLIHIDEQKPNIPTLSLCYNTRSNLTNGVIDSDEACWNLACWNTNEIPVIGNNFKITNEAIETTQALKEWFVANNCNYSEIEKDPLDNFYEYTIGYRVLADTVRAIAPEIKKMLKELYGCNVICLIGDLSFIPSDIERIVAINDQDVEPFIQYFDDDSSGSESPSMESDHVAVEFTQDAIELFEKLKKDFEFDEEKLELISEVIEKFKKFS